MTRIVHRLLFGSISGLGRPMLGRLIDSSWPSAAEAAKLDKFLTSTDLAGRMVLDQNGQQLSFQSRDRHPAVPKGSTPTYLAIPLTGGEHLPGTVPTLDYWLATGSKTVGPLNFDAQFKAALDTVSTRPSWRSSRLRAELPSRIPSRSSPLKFGYTNAGGSSRTLRMK